MVIVLLRWGIEWLLLRKDVKLISWRITLTAGVIAWTCRLLVVRRCAMTSMMLLSNWTTECISLQAIWVDMFCRFTTDRWLLACFEVIRSWYCRRCLLLLQVRWKGWLLFCLMARGVWATRLVWVVWYHLRCWRTKTYGCLLWVLVLGSYLIFSWVATNWVLCERDGFFKVVKRCLVRN